MARLRQVQRTVPPENQEHLPAGRHYLDPRLLSFAPPAIIANGVPRRLHRIVRARSVPVVRILPVSLQAERVARRDVGRR